MRFAPGKTPQRTDHSAGSETRVLLLAAASVTLAVAHGPAVALATGAQSASALTTSTEATPAPAPKPPSLLLSPVPLAARSYRPVRVSAGVRSAIPVRVIVQVRRTMRGSAGPWRAIASQNDDRKSLGQTAYLLGAAAHAGIAAAPARRRDDSNGRGQRPTEDSYRRRPSRRAHVRRRAVGAHDTARPRSAAEVRRHGDLLHHRKHSRNSTRLWCGGSSPRGMGSEATAGRIASCLGSPTPPSGTTCCARRRRSRRRRVGRCAGFVHRMVRPHRESRPPSAGPGWSRCAGPSTRATGRRTHRGRS